MLAVGAQMTKSARAYNGLPETGTLSEIVAQNINLTAPDAVTLSLIVRFLYGDELMACLHCGVSVESGRQEGPKWTQYGIF
jgi:hypothetical protein